MTIDAVLLSLLAKDPTLINSLRSIETVQTSPTTASVGLLPYQCLLQNAYLQQQQQQQQQAAVAQAAISKILQDAALQNLLLSATHVPVNTIPTTLGLASSVPASASLATALSANEDLKKALMTLKATTPKIEVSPPCKHEVQASSVKPSTILSSGMTTNTTTTTTKRISENSNNAKLPTSLTTIGSKSVKKDDRSLTMPKLDDVLLGRGKTSSSHPGNLHFMELVLSKKEKYVSATKKQKRQIANDIIKEVQSEGGRFLQKDRGSALWYVSVDSITRIKISRALREGAPELRKGFQEKSAAAEALIGLACLT